MEQKELFHFYLEHPLSIYNVFMSKGNDFDIVSLKYDIDTKMVKVGIYCYPRELFWIGFEYCTNRLPND